MSFDDALSAGVDRVRNALDQRQMVKIYSHVDADGLAAGAILAKILTRAHVPHQVRILRQLELTFIDQIAQEYTQTPFLSFFTDFGSGQIEFLAQRFSPEDVVILDHHEIPPDTTTQLPYHYNPELLGRDGGKEISGAGMCYSFGRVFNPENTDLAELAVVGATGDRQDQGQGHALIGLNQEIASDGVAAGTVEMVEGIRLFGRETRSIANAISMSTDPFIKGLSGNPGVCEHIITSLGIELYNAEKNRPRSLAELSPEETQTLMSGLVNFCVVNLNADPQLVLNLIGTIYTFPREPEGKPLRDAQEYASLLNSCGRTGHPDIAIGIAMGDRVTMITEAESILNDYRHQLGEILGRIEQDKVIAELEHIYFLDGEGFIEERVIGTICSLALGTLGPDVAKPLIGVASSDEGMIKVSGRAPPAAISAGIDLAKLMREVAQDLEVESPGGGHAAAAGARIPAPMKENLMALLDRKIGEILER
jgi:RecJ-like exonuclease